MALGALQGSVGSGQRELGHGGVVEGRGRPGGGCMALVAGLRKSSAYVRRVRGPLEVSQMAGHALRGSAGEVPARVALRALHADVRTCKWKCRLGVIERGVEPGGRVVTLLARLREAAGHVIGIGCTLEVG